MKPNWVKPGPRTGEEKLDEERVRQIVREELEKAKDKDSVSTVDLRSKRSVNRHGPTEEKVSKRA